MPQLPDFWRTEVYHPLFVHFPIALLLMGTFFKIFALWGKGLYLSFPGTILLVIGTISGWLAIYTGSLADGIVSRTICDPTVLKDHENAAYTMIWLFTVALIIDVSYHFNLLKLKKRLVHFLVVLMLITGSGFLAYVGHLGVSLVYQQAAGVYRPSSDCSEFN